MRVFITLVSWLAASSAVAQTPDAVAMPPLDAGDSAPTDIPNSFDARELGMATLAVRLACQEVMASSVPDAADTIPSPYCDCFADAARWNVRRSARSTPTDSQTAGCADAIRAPAAWSPGEAPLPTRWRQAIGYSRSAEIAAGER